MTALELARNIIDNDRDPDPTYRMDIAEAARLLREFRLDDEAGDLADITAEALADAYNDLVEED